VADATDAARGAADIVLLTPGLGVIIQAIISSRKIFQRMVNYCMYTVASTVRVVILFGVLTIAFDFYFPTLLICFLAIFNDLACIAISTDTVTPNKNPDSWNLLRIFVVSTAMGLWLFASGLTLWLLVKYTAVFEVFNLKSLSDEELRGLMYLQVSVSGHMAIFSTRVVDGFFFQSRPSNWLIIMFFFAQGAATAIAVVGFYGYPLDGEADFRGCGPYWGAAGWFWCIAWFIPLDLIKFFTYHTFQLLQGNETLRTATKSSGAHPVYGAPAVSGGGIWPKSSHQLDHSAVIKKAQELPRPSFEDIERPRPSVDIDNRPIVKPPRSSRCIVC